MTALLRIRDSARRLVLELTVLGLLAVVFTVVPPDGATVQGWDFLAPVLAFVAHAVVGVVVLVDAGWLTIVAVGTADPSCVYLPAVGLAAAMLAVVAGAISLAGLGPADVGLAMVLGWAVALGVDAAQWRRSSRAIAGLRGAVAAPGATARR